MGNNFGYGRGLVILLVPLPAFPSCLADKDQRIYLLEARTTYIRHGMEDRKEVLQLQVILLNHIVKSR